MPKDLLQAKLKQYAQHGISTSPGGLSAELALKTGRYEKFVDDVVATGFSGIEVSDNLLKLNPKDKNSAIKVAKDKGPKVFGEVGRKEGSLDDDTLIHAVQVCVDAGADWVFLEASELFSGNQVRDKLIGELASAARLKS